MPPDPSARTSYAASGRCYCGRTTLSCNTPAQTVTYCHCDDCRRITGAPVAAFATFAAGDLDIVPDPGPVSANPGVKRWFCRNCGSPLAAWFAYLPDQIFVPIGVVDQAGDLAPELHCHADSCLPWLHIDDDLERTGASGRASLRSARPDSSDAG